MVPPAPDLRKEREVLFQGPHPDPEQAASAALLLADVPGIEAVEVVTAESLRVAYDIRHMTIKAIEEALDEVGFHLDNSLICKIRRTIWYYAEDTQRANLGCEHDSNCTRRIFIHHYQEREHGCRDERPQHWRRYL